jgi:hypothetical protein
MHIKKLFRILRWLIAFAVLPLLASCGGGGCDAEVIFGKIASCTAEKDSVEEFTAAASMGELVRYKINKKSMTYSYTIISSAYGLNNVSKTGRLKYNADDDTFTPVELGSKIAFNADGLFYGVIKENFGSGEIVAPVFGVKNIENNISNMADDYNFISYQCVGSSPCRSSYGSVRVKSTGDWEYCIGGNLSDVASTCISSVRGFGYYDSSANKIILRDQSFNVVGSAISYVKGRQKVFVIDLDGGSPFMGKGVVVASSQSDIPSSMDGTWRYIRMQKSGNVIISGLNLTQYVDEVSNPFVTYFTLHDPWQGFVTTPNGTVALAAGSGMYAATYNGEFSVGLKK